MVSFLILFSGLILSGLDVVETPIPNGTEQSYNFYYYLITSNEPIPGQVLFKYIVGITSSIVLSSTIFLVFLIKYESDKTIRKTSIVILNMLKQGIIKTSAVEAKPSTALTTAPPQETIRETGRMLRPVSREEMTRSIPTTRPPSTTISRPEKPTRPPIRTPLKRCPYCGGVLPLGDVHVFCPHCGKRLK